MQLCHDRIDTKAKSKIPVGCSVIAAVSSINYSCEKICKSVNQQFQGLENYFIWSLRLIEASINNNGIKNPRLKTTEVYAQKLHQLT